MIITYLGLQAFKIQPKSSDDGIVVINPFDQKIGLKMTKIESNILLLSDKNSPNNSVDKINNNTFLISSAGEYDIKNVGIQGIDAYSANNSKNIIYKINVENISIVHLGTLTKKLEAKHLEEINKVDILIVPISNIEGKVTEIINQIEPRMIIPMSYKTPGLDVELEDINKFIKDIGLTPTYEDKLKIFKKDLPQDETELVVLNIK